MTPLDELTENLMQKKRQKQHVISVDYVLRMLKEAERQSIPLRPPERVV